MCVDCGNELLILFRRLSLHVNNAFPRFFSRVLNQFSDALQGVCDIVAAFLTAKVRVRDLVPQSITAPLDHCVNVLHEAHDHVHQHCCEGCVGPRIWNLRIVAACREPLTASLVHELQQIRPHQVLNNDTHVIVDFDSREISREQPIILRFFLVPDTGNMTRRQVRDAHVTLRNDEGLLVLCVSAAG